MRPLILHGHAKPLSTVRYNREGDLLFTSALEPKTCVWYSVNGERLGTYNGSEGATTHMDITYDTSHLLASSGAYSAWIWDVETGKLVHKLAVSGPARRCGWSFSGNLFFVSFDCVGARASNPSELLVFDVRDLSNSGPDGPVPVWRRPIENSKLTAAVWAHLDDRIITGHENGDVSLYDLTSRSRTANGAGLHRGRVVDIQMSSDQAMAVTASKDTTARLVEASTLELRRTYQTDRPVNSASISPTHDHVVLGGGQEARDVTTTAQGAGKFFARFFHLIFEDEFARVKGHFGPINSIQFAPDGSGYASGGEDGFVRVHIFDPEYDEFDKRVYGGGSLVSDVARAVLADEAEPEPDDAGELHDDEERSSPRAGAESDEERHRDD
jgi:translation initiation factor 3 subunit I